MPLRYSQYVAIESEIATQSGEMGDREDNIEGPNSKEHFKGLESTESEKRRFRRHRVFQVFLEKR